MIRDGLCDLVEVEEGGGLLYPQVARHKARPHCGY